MTLMRVLVALCGLALFPRNLVMGDGPLDVVWDSASATEMDSMPLGNGDISGNVWVNSTTGTLMFYLAKSDAWAELGGILKVAKFELETQPPIFTPAAAGSDEAPCQFQQRLSIKEGAIHIIGSSCVNLRVWVDAVHPNLRVDADVQANTTAFNATLTLHPIRPQDEANPVADSEDCKVRYFSKDVIVSSNDKERLSEASADAPSIAWYHRNREDWCREWWSESLTLQGLGDLLPHFPHPHTNFTWGGAAAVRSNDGDWNANSRVVQLGETRLGARDTSSVSFSISLDRDVTVDQQDIDQWVDRVTASAQAFPADYEEHKAWWASFWGRSNINITCSSTSSTPEALAFNITAKYVYQRFLDAANGRLSKSPIKFNGQAFVVDTGKGADYRGWGAGYWWQNTRQPYHNMLAAGDYDMLRPLYEFYVKALPLLSERTKIYFNHTGVFFPETMMFNGLYENAGWGWGCDGHDTPATQFVPNNPYIRYHIMGGLELTMMLLDDYLYTQDAQVAREYLLPIADAVLDYYHQHWTGRDEHNKLVMFPSQSLETWQCKTVPPTESDCVTNPTPDVAGLLAVLPRMIALPDSLVSPARLKVYKELFDSVPDLPTALSDEGNLYVTPGEALPSSSSNSENTGLYSVHPFRLIRQHSSWWERGTETYSQRKFPCNDGWCQDVMDAALLGLTAAAQTMVEQRAAAQTWKYPGFAPSYQDFAPSLDHLSTMRTALHFMILQSGGDPMAPDHSGDGDHTIYLFPSFPSNDWNVEFSLMAPYNTNISGKCVDGVLTELKVDPPSRSKDITFGQTCQPSPELLSRISLATEVA